MGTLRACSVGTSPTVTRHCGVFGHPLSHSISPVFQQSAFDALGLDVIYEAWDVEPAHFPDRLAELRLPRYLGANVTIPHKVQALQLADVQTPLASAIGAANTLVMRHGRLEAHNTDVHGFLTSLTVDGQCDVLGSDAVILGAGGAARAVALALMLAGVQQITIANRNKARAAMLAASMDGLAPTRVGELRAQVAGRVGIRPHQEHTPTLVVVPWDSDALRSALERANVIVNSTSLGMRGVQEGTTPLPPLTDLRPSTLLVDIVANPLETRLMREARQRGLRVVGGLPMLIYQGAASFAIWTGLEPPVARMFKAAHAYMEHMR